jgi:hypothetical protein
VAYEFAQAGTNKRIEAEFASRPKWAAAGSEADADSPADPVIH